MFGSLASINECQGEFIAQYLPLDSQYAGVEKYSELSTDCQADLQSNGLVVLIAELKKGYSNSTEASEYAAPEGYRYIYYDELLQESNANLK